MTRKLLLLVVFVLAALGGIAWFVVRGSRARGTERADNPEVELPREARTQLSAESLPLEARSAEQGEAVAKSSADSEERTGKGTVRVRVLDAGSHAPVAGLGLTVFRERFGDKDLARGKTDAQGRAEFRDLEANTILVRTERRPPYASQIGGVWLEPAATRDLEVLVGPGSAVTGRVVDDLEQPVVGAAFFMGEKDCRLDDPEPVARSGEDGRFRVECVSSTPRGVWIIDGKTRPERWIPAALTLVKDVVQRQFSADVESGEDLDLGDVELERRAALAGSVVDSQERGIAGALLGARNERQNAREFPLPANAQSPFRFGPADAEFVLFAGETLCDAAGRFELLVAPHTERVHALTRDGLIQTFKVPATAPGERSEGLVLKFAPATRIDFELVNELGERVRPRIPGQTRGMVRTSWNKPLHDWFGALALRARTLDDTESEFEGRCGSDGIWRVQLALAPQAIEEFTASVTGYEPVHEHPAGTLPASSMRKYTLVALPGVRVRILPRDPEAKRLSAPGAPLGISVCLGTPARRKEVRSQGLHLWCCGSGSQWTGDWDGAPFDCVLPVRTRGAFWIYVDGMDSLQEPCTLCTLGPFEPGAEVHEVPLDPLQLGRFDVPRQEPPSASTFPGEKATTLCARVVDARSGAGIEDAMIWLRPAAAGEDAHMPGLEITDGGGRVRDQSITAGRWKIIVSANHYRDAKLGERECRAGDTLDLGTVALEPLPVHRGRVLAADGKAAAGLRIQESSGARREDGGNIGAGTRDDGSFEIHGDLPQHVLLDVVQDPTGEGFACGAQRFVLDSWPETEVRDLDLAPTRRLVVRLSGVGESSVLLYACPAPGEATSNCDHRAPVSGCVDSLACAHELGSGPSTKRFEFFLAPGRYQLWGGGVLYDVPVTEVTLGAGDGDIELTITAH